MAPATIASGPITKHLRFREQELVLTEAELERQAINESVRVAPYDDEWPAQFCAERNRLIPIAPELLAVEHVGSTAVPGLAAKPIIDMMAAVPSMEVADRVVERLCSSGYITSAEFNRSLGDRRWLMRHAGGHRTHHLHLVLASSRHWMECIRFRDALRRDSRLAARYADLKQRLAVQFGSDRDGYGNAKAEFITSALMAEG
jgi:GrpB-like predicted nucleotidyltransferase (UPF0157 family)